jgi:hypothetical protein
MRRAVAVALSLVALAGCNASGLAFKEDTRVDIVSPREGAEVTLPLTISWHARDIQVSEPGEGDGVFYAVFVDRPPLRPRQSLEALVGDDCLTRGCANVDYFAQRDVHITAGTAVVLDQLPPGDSHTATIVLVDQDYHRVGESAFVVEFRNKDDE